MAVLFTTPLFASPYGETMTLRFGFIGIVTHDMAASLAFYRALGVSIDEGQDDAPHVDATLDGGVTIAWDTIETIRGFDPGFVPATGGHRIALAFDLGTPDEVDAAFAAIVVAGYPAHVEPWDAHWGQHYATLLDPDGNSVDLYAALPAN
ncbi:hypothetical protein SRABI76_02767 [Microbacterium oxydans]|nr:hypothetical protein SRABI76_02767 [Microbacterium oxydans]